MTMQIDIKELIPFMKDGWVAMEEWERWYWYDEKPFIEDGIWVFEGCSCANLDAFNIKPVKNWRESLIKVENKDE